MSLLSIVVVLIVVGVLLWLVESVIPLDATIRKIIRVIVIVVVVLWLLSVFGLLPSLGAVHVGRIR